MRSDHFCLQVIWNIWLLDKLGNDWGSDVDANRLNISSSYLFAVIFVPLCSHTSDAQKKSGVISADTKIMHRLLCFRSKGFVQPWQTCVKKKCLDRAQWADWVGSTNMLHFESLLSAILEYLIVNPKATDPFIKSPTIVSYIFAFLQKCSIKN